MGEQLTHKDQGGKTGIGILLMVFSSLCACFGQMFWKLSAEGSFLLLLIGLALYGVGAVIMLVAYRFGKLSVLQPIMSMNYVFAILIGKLVFSEGMPVMKLGGIVAVIFGVVLIGGENE
jgi:undecaprenyl phosphate-alpha-L-ara4N flippase subunit ArnE